MATPTVIGGVLVLLAPLFAALALHRFHRRGAREDRVTRMLGLLWFGGGLAGALLLAPVAGRAIYTAFLLLFGGVLLATAWSGRSHLGAVVFRTRLGPLNWLFLVAAGVFLAEAVHTVATCLFVTEGIGFHRAVLQPILGLAFLGLGLTRLEVRAQGLVTGRDFVDGTRWEDITGYAWDGKQERRLTIHRKPLGFLVGAMAQHTVRADERETVDTLLAERVPRVAGVAAEPA